MEIITSINVTKDIPYDMTIRIHRVKFGEASIGSLVVSPTGNCQLNSWRQFNSVLRHTPPFSMFKEWYDKFKDERKLLLVDIKEDLIDDLKNYVGEDKIVMVSPYKSTNGSKMYIVLINMG